MKQFLFKNKLKLMHLSFTISFENFTRKLFIKLSYRVVPSLGAFENFSKSFILYDIHFTLNIT